MLMVMVIVMMMMMMMMMTILNFATTVRPVLLKKIFRDIENFRDAL